MACDVPTLLEEACGSEFLQLAQNEAASRALILELLYQADGGSETYAELQAQACENGFYQAAQNEHQFRSLVLQLLCEATA